MSYRKRNGFTDDEVLAMATEHVHLRMGSPIDRPNQYWIDLAIDEKLDELREELPRAPEYDEDERPEKFQ